MNSSTLKDAAVGLAWFVGYLAAYNLVVKPFVISPLANKFPVLKNL